MNQQHLRHKAVTGVLWLGSVKLVAQVTSWVFTILVIRILTPEDYGLFGLAMLAVGFVHIFNQMGLRQAIIQKQPLGKQELSSLFWFNLIVSCGLYVLVVLTAPLVAAFFANERLTLLLRVLGLNLILVSLGNIQLSMLLKEMSHDKKAKAGLIANLVGGLTAVTCAHLGFGVWSLALGSIALNFALTLLLTYNYRWRPSSIFDFDQITQLLRFGFKIVGSRLLWYSYTTTDSLIIGKMLGERFLGLYSIASHLSTKGIDLLSEILSQVCLPLYATLQRDTHSLQTYFVKLSKLVALIVFPTFTGLILVADDLFTVVLTDTWRPAVSVFQILCGVAMVRGLAFLIPQLLIGTGRANLNLRYTFLCSIVLPPAFLAGSLFGLSGVAYAWLLIYPLLASYALMLVREAIGLRLNAYLSSLLPAISSTAVMCCAVLLFQSTLASDVVLARLVGSCAVGIITYVIFLQMVFRGFQEFAFVVPILRASAT